MQPHDSIPDCQYQNENVLSPFSLANKRILVIGLSSELERSIVRQLIDNGATHIIAVDESITVTEMCDVLETDILDYSKIESTVTSMKSMNLSFDGILFLKTESDFRPLAMNTPAKVFEIMKSNFLIFLEFMRLLIKKRMLNRGASVVAMSSISSIHAMKAKTVFAAAKAALDSSVRCMASELSDKGIRVNTIQKGSVDADMMKGHIQTVSELNNGGESKRQPLGLVKAEEIGNLITLLLSDACPSITGTSIVIDGGYLL